jgi:hypothetical protein
LARTASAVATWAASSPWRHFFADGDFGQFDATLTRSRQSVCEDGFRRLASELDFSFFGFFCPDFESGVFVGRLQDGPT